MKDALAMVAAYVIATALGHVSLVVTSALLARWARVPIDEAKIGAGPRLFSFRLLGAPVHVHLFWTTASVQFRGMLFDKPFEPPAPPLRAWLDVPRWQRAILQTASRFGPLLFALPLLGAGETVHAIMRGIVDYPAAFYGSQPLLDLAAARLHAHGFAALVAIVVTKVFAASLYAIPSTLAFLFRPPTEGKLGPTAKLAIVPAFLLMVVGLAWTVDFVRWTIAHV